MRRTRTGSAATPSLAGAALRDRGLGERCLARRSLLVWCRAERTRHALPCASFADVAWEPVTERGTLQCCISASANGHAGLRLSILAPTKLPWGSHPVTLQQSRVEQGCPHRLTCVLIHAGTVSRGATRCGRPLGALCASAALYAPALPCSFGLAHSPMSFLTLTAMSAFSVSVRSRPRSCDFWAMELAMS